MSISARLCGDGTFGEFCKKPEFCPNGFEPSLFSASIKSSLTSVVGGSREDWRRKVMGWKGAGMRSLGTKNGFVKVRVDAYFAL